MDPAARAHIKGPPCRKISSIFSAITSLCEPGAGVTGELATGSGAVRSGFCAYTGVRIGVNSITERMTNEINRFFIEKPAVKNARGKP